MSTVYDRNFFDQQASRSLQSARIVLRKVFGRLKPDRVVDIGCGVGSWMQAALELGAQDVIGVDGDYVDRRMLMVEPERFVAADIVASRLPEVLKDRLHEPFDLVVCLEVAEHLPFERAALFVEELTRLGDAILFSAAVPYQFGANHVNEQWPEFWAILFRAHGFGCWDWLRAGLWADREVDWWYAQNTLMFARNDSRAARLLPTTSRTRGKSLSLVHPENFLSNLLERPRTHGRVAAEEELADRRAVSAADLQSATRLPPLAAISRAMTADPDARNVFPWTRSEVSRHEDEVRQARERLVAVEELARIEITRREEAERLTCEEARRREEAERLAREEFTRREEAERLTCEEARRREEAERLAREEFARREEAERLTCEEARRREEAERLAREEFARREEAERLTREEARRREEAERLAREEFARREEAERLTREEAEKRFGAALNEQRAARLWAEEQLKVAAEHDDGALREAYAVAAALRHHLSVLQASTVWRATIPLRTMGARLPMPLRRLARGSAKLAWWCATMQLRQKLAERQQRVPRRGPPSVLLLSEPSSVLPDCSPNMSTSTAILPVAGAVQAPEGKAVIPHQGFLHRFSPSKFAEAVERLRRFKPFTPSSYLALNADVGAEGVDPVLHLLSFGAFEGRQAFRHEDLAKVMGEYLGSGAATAPGNRTGGRAADAVSLLSKPPHVCLYVSSVGNIFMKEIAGDFAADLQTAGIRVEVRDELSPIEDRPMFSLFVAPHEFFMLGRGTEWLREDVVSRSFMLSTEQVQTPWFTKSLPLLLTSRGVIDICYQTADLLAQAGVPSLHLLPGARLRPTDLTESDRTHPLFQALPCRARATPEPSTPFAKRNLDVAFFGTSSAYRETFFARHGARMAEFEAFIYCRRGCLGPIQDNQDDGGLTRLAGHVSGHSKITLNIHRDEFGYFEWHRMVRLGMCSGSLVVSDPCLPHPSFVPGTHYFEERPRYIPDLLDWLLRTEDGALAAERVRANVDALFAKSFDPRENSLKLLKFMFLDSA